MAPAARRPGLVPFDRLLIAKTEVENIALVTGDEAMTDYEAEVIW